MTTTKTSTAYGHTAAAVENTCTCGRDFSTTRGLTIHVNHARRTDAANHLAEQAGIRAEMRARVQVSDDSTNESTDYREHITFENGPLWDAIYHTLGMSGLVNLVTIETSNDNGVITITLHTKAEPATWELPEFEVWAFFRSVANGDLLDLDSLSHRFAGTEVGLHIVTVLMFLFLDPRKATR